MAQSEKAEKISITLPPEMLAAIKEKVRAGSYGSTSEVIREAMRLWQKQDEEREMQLAVIRQRLENSANSGTPVPLKKAFARIEKIHLQNVSGADDEDL